MICSALSFASALVRRNKTTTAMGLNNLYSRQWYLPVVFQGTIAGAMISLLILERHY